MKLIVKRPIKEVSMEEFAEVAQKNERLTVYLTLNYTCVASDLTFAFDFMAT